MTNPVTNIGFMIIVRENEDDEWRAIVNRRPAGGFSLSYGAPPRRFYTRLEALNFVANMVDHWPDRPSIWDYYDVDVVPYNYVRPKRDILE